MRWFRTHRILGARVALFALVVQFTLAFGHVHGFATDAGAAARAAAATFDSAIDKPSSPAPLDRGQDSADGWCAICAIIHLTGSAQVAASPVLPLPVTYSVKIPSLLSEAASDDPRCFELRSRGPPQA